MPTISVTVHSRFPVIAAAALAKAAIVTAKAAHDIEANAKARAPVDTGLLKSSIGASGGGLSWRVDSPVNYSVYQEFGTSKMAAHPYMIPAASAVAPSFLAGMKAIL